MSTDGIAELKARLKAIRVNVAKPAGKEWADEAVLIARGRVGVDADAVLQGRPARLRPSGARRATAAARPSWSPSTTPTSWTLASSRTRMKARASTVRRASAEGRTIFARAGRKPHPGYKARPFRGRTAAEALKRKPIRDKVVKAWNEAA